MAWRGSLQNPGVNDGDAQQRYFLEDGDDAVLIRCRLTGQVVSKLFSGMRYGGPERAAERARVRCARLNAEAEAPAEPAQR